jgi:tetratricopeptide (TPR) repeat protein
MANEAYQRADYSGAESLYRGIIDSGKHSAKLYFNLANTLFKQEKLGEAILYYNKALRLAPADEDIRHNLEYAEQMTRDSIEEIPEFILTTWVRAVRGALSSTVWCVLSLVLLVVSLSMMLVYLLAQRLSLRKTGFYVMVVAGVLFILTTIFAWSEGRMDVEHREAVIMNSAVSIKSSPDRAATELFVLHEGTKVVIGETISGWAEVRIADGRKGWIEESRIERI